jgi:hypothetical protein
MPKGYFLFCKKIIMKKTIRSFISLSLVITISLTSCTNYGKKVSQDYLEIYYKDGISREQAEKTVKFLYPYWKDKTSIETSKKSVQLTKTGDTVNFRMVSDEKKMKLVDDETFYTMSNIFSDSLFNHSPVNLVLTDNHFKTIRTLHFKKMELSEPAASVDSAQ